MTKNKQTKNNKFKKKNKKKNTTTTGEGFRLFWQHVYPVLLHAKFVISTEIDLLDDHYF